MQHTLIISVHEKRASRAVISQPRMHGYGVLTWVSAETKAGYLGRHGQNWWDLANFHKDNISKESGTELGVGLVSEESDDVI